MMSQKDPRDIWIFAEIEEDGLREVVFELLSEGRRLADQLNEKLCVVILAEDLKNTDRLLSQFGVDTIYYSKMNHGVDAYTHILSQLIQKYTPRLMLLGATSLGNELGSRIAIRNGIRIIAGCVILRMNNRGFLEVTKMIHGDNVYATLEAPPSRTLIVTVIARSCELAEQGPERETELVTENIEMDRSFSKLKYLHFVKGDPKKIDIEDAEIIVAFGRGVGGEEGIKKIERLAELLNGSIAGSRVAVDHKWVPYERQIGVSGKTVSPKLIVTCGISGAFEFTVAMKSSRSIVAINNDPNARIFQISNLSLVEDFHKVVPEIIEQLENYLREGIK